MTETPIETSGNPTEVIPPEISTFLDTATPGQLTMLQELITQRRLTFSETQMKKLPRFDSLEEMLNEYTNKFPRTKGDTELILESFEQIQNQAIEFLKEMASDRNLDATFWEEVAKTWEISITSINTVNATKEFFFNNGFAKSADWSFINLDRLKELRVLMNTFDDDPISAHLAKYKEAFSLFLRSVEMAHKVIEA